MKKLVCLASLLVMLAGCSEEKKAPSQGSTKNMESTTALSSSVNSSNKTIKSTEEKAAATSKTAQAKTVESSSESEIPYAVNIAKLGESATFNFKGINVPTSITLQQTDTGVTVTFYVKPTSSDALESKNVFNAEIQNIPTKEIRIFSADGSGIRTVKVNTEIKLNSLIMAEGNARVESESLYLFNNKNGGVSLVTPNYAGNVLDDQKDVMLEVLQ
jgi:archaellum component FlaG (FlaF/FlaG flagellin family)